jgi:hypothetical protein
MWSRGAKESAAESAHRGVHLRRDSGVGGSLDYRIKPGSTIFLRYFYSFTNDSGDKSVHSLFDNTPGLQVMCAAGGVEAPGSAWLKRLETSLVVRRDKHKGPEKLVRENIELCSLAVIL